MEVQKQLGVDILLCVFVFISIKSTYKMPGVVPNSSHIKIFGFFTVFLGDLEGSPHSSYIQKHSTIRVKG